jgi:hypothetical protein
LINLINGEIYPIEKLVLSFKINFWVHTRRGWLNEIKMIRMILFKKGRSAERDWYQRKEMHKMEEFWIMRVLLGLMNNIRTCKWIIWGGYICLEIPHF